MSRIVSTKLPTDHKATSPPRMRSEPVRAASTSAIGLRNRSATLAGSVDRNESTARSASALCPNSDPIAAARMKKGKSVSSAR